MKQIQFLTAFLILAANRAVGLSCQINPSGVVRRYTGDPLTILRGSFGRASTTVRELLGGASGEVRGRFEVCSGEVRELFEVCSGVVRELFEVCSRVVRGLFEEPSRNVRQRSRIVRERSRKQPQNAESGQNGENIPISAFRCINRIGNPAKRGQTVGEKWANGEHVVGKAPVSARVAVVAVLPSSRLGVGTGGAWSDRSVGWIVARLRQTGQIIFCSTHQSIQRLPGCGISESVFGAQNLVL